MSPAEQLAEIIEASFPRVSGDEPLGDATLTSQYTFSPRERG